MSQANHPSFSPEMVDIIDQAYEEAIECLGVQNTQSGQRAILGKFIVDMAQAGETDRQKLRDASVWSVKRFAWIRHQAHEIWESEGRPHGRDEAHWAQAEQEFALFRHEID